MLTFGMFIAYPESTLCEEVNRRAIEIPYTFPENCVKWNLVVKISKFSTHLVHCLTQIGIK